MSNEEKLVGLERKLHEMRREYHFMLAALVCIGIVSVLALRPAEVRANADKEIRANRFVLEDSRGICRGSLDLTPDGPELTMSDVNGTKRMQLRFSNLQFLDDRGHISVNVALAPNGPMLMLYGLHEKPECRNDYAWLSPECMLLAKEEGYTAFDAAGMDIFQGSATETFPKDENVKEEKPKLVKSFR